MVGDRPTNRPTDLPSIHPSIIDNIPETSRIVLFFSPNSCITNTKIPQYCTCDVIASTCPRGVPFLSSCAISKWPSLGRRSRVWVPRSYLSTMYQFMQAPKLAVLIIQANPFLIKIATNVVMWNIFTEGHKLHQMFVEVDLYTEQSDDHNYFKEE